MTLSRKTIALCCCLSACLAASELLAQSNGARGDSRNRGDQNQMRQRDQRDQGSRRDQRRGDRRGSQSDRRAEPVGWVGVAYDYDNDGRYEGVDYIYYYDLQRARQSSQRRGSDQAGRQSMDRSGDQRDRRRDQGSQGDRDRRQARVSGEVTKMGTTSVVMGGRESSDREMKYVHIKTDSGKSVRAYVGSPDKARRLDLREGDKVTVEGVKARINDKKVLLAHKVKANGESITNKMPRPERWTRKRGEVRDVRTAGGDDRGERHLVVELKGDDGTCTVDLGPEDALGGLDLQRGDRVAVLAREGKIGGQKMYIAQKVRANDRTIDVRDETSRSLSQSDNARRNRQR
ncbi:hypothetical protein [Botrimarina sp.]|uniref:hypothetical protein n=1 Tax=Botrimarina sp. TaxID=2795802 RepID=UPI0032EDE363